MARQKAKRIADSEQKPNIIQPGKPFFDACKGHWHQDYFKNDNPIVVELGCGKGEYTIGMAQQRPNANFLGCDLKGPRMWVGADYAVENNLRNTAFLRVQIQNLEMFFAPSEISEVWIPFPDPRSKDGDAKRRLTSPRFQEQLRRLLKPGGKIHLKTDNRELYFYTLEVLAETDCTITAATDDLYNSSFFKLNYGIITYFEKRYLAKGQPIYFIQYHFNLP